MDFRRRRTYLPKGDFDESFAFRNEENLFGRFGMPLVFIAASDLFHEFLLLSFTRPLKGGLRAAVPDCQPGRRLIAGENHRRPSLQEH
jgi:hypothetical protein